MTAFLGSSSRGANVATVVLTGVLAVLVWRTFLQPLRGQVAASTERLAAIEDEIARARGALARRQALEQEIARLEARVGAMRGHGDLGSLVGLQEAAADGRTQQPGGVLRIRRVDDADAGTVREDAFT